MKIKKSIPILILTAALLVVSQTPLHAQQTKTSSAAKATKTSLAVRTNDEWLRFRGPNGTGVAEGSALPIEFGSGKNLVWKTTVPFARSSPVVTANRVFLTASEGDKLITLALDRKTGKILWQREVARARHITKIGTYPKGVPIIGTDMIYVTAGGADEPFFPPFDASLKQFDKDNDQKIQREEAKSNAEAYDHFGWMDSNSDGYIDRTEYEFVRTSSAGGHGLTAIRLGGQGDLTSTTSFGGLKNPTRVFLHR